MEAIHEIVPGLMVDSLPPPRFPSNTKPNTEPNNSMRTLDSIVHIRARLKNVALAATIGMVALSTVAPSAKAALVGQWLSGADDYTETSGAHASGTHDGVAVGNTENLSFTTDVPPGYSGRSWTLPVVPGCASPTAPRSTQKPAWLWFEN